ncbi:MAG: hypothetical protein KC731_29105 [Myxococcales bacterium]|nr:hypothetical protein [Myxococcales bacterium]
MGDTVPGEEPQQSTVCHVCTPEGLECARLKLQLNKHLTLHEAYSKIASGRSGEGPSLFQRGTTRLYNEQDQSTFGALATENHAQMKALLEEYKNKGCDPDDVLEHRKAVHNYQPPGGEGVMGAGKWVAGKGAEYVLDKVPLIGEIANDAINGIEEVYEQNAVPF